MKRIEFAGETVSLCPEGALFWPAQSMLAVSDLHLEKGSSYAARGSFLPPYDTAETLKRLERLCAAYAPQKLLFLGDVFHDRDSCARLSSENREAISRLRREYETLWIEGNHDPDTAPEGVTTHKEIRIGAITFRHMAFENSAPEISGHYHPCVNLRHKGQTIRRPCFVVTGSKIILPAFGAYTGGMDIKTPEFQSAINHKKIDIFVSGQGNVMRIKTELLQ